MITYGCGAWDSDTFTCYKTNEKTLIYSVPTTHLPFISLHSEDVQTKLFNTGEAVKWRLWRAGGVRITVIYSVKTMPEWKHGNQTVLYGKKYNFYLYHFRSFIVSYISDGMVVMYQRIIHLTLTRL